MVLGIEFVGGGVTHELHIAAVAYGFTSQLVVEVHKDLFVGHLDDLSLDAHTLLSHHGDAGAGTHMLVVKLAVDVEDLFLEFVDQFRVLHTKGLLGLEGEIKLFALLQAHDVVLEALDEREVHTEHKGIGMLLIELENTDLAFLVNHKNLIHEFDIFAGLNFLHLNRLLVSYQ